jgi:hypothetical protein
LKSGEVQSRNFFGLDETQAFSAENFVFEPIHPGIYRKKRVSPIDRESRIRACRNMQTAAGHPMDSSASRHAVPSQGGASAGPWFSPWKTLIPYSEPDLLSFFRSAEQPEFFFVLKQ